MRLLSTGYLFTRIPVSEVRSHSLFITRMAISEQLTTITLYIITQLYKKEIYFFLSKNSQLVYIVPSINETKASSASLARAS